MTDRRRRRRRVVASVLLWAYLCVLWCEREVPFVRRRLSQLLRGGASVNSSPRQYHVEASIMPAEEAIATVPLHATRGTHHVHVYIGSPPQRQTLIVDTGSRLMAFPCQPCRGCGSHASQYFDLSISTTDVIPICGNCFRTAMSKCSEFNDRCILTQRYTEGSSWTAFEVEDVVWFGTSSVHQSVEDLMQLAVPYTFGCQTSEHGLFRKQYADGILGLARHETSLVHAMHAAGAIPRNAFSLCFTRSGGHLSLGGIRSNHHHLQPMKFSPIQGDDGMFSLYVEDVRVGDGSILMGQSTHVVHSFATGKGTILDSGTTDTFLPKAVADVLTRVWKEWSGLDYSNEPRSYTLEEFERLPDVTIRFAGNVTLTIAPSSYMEGLPSHTQGIQPSWKGKRELTNRMYADEPTGAVLGANAMFGYDILFDVQDQRVGLARADCAIDIGASTENE